MEAILSDRSRFIKTHLSQFGPLVSNARKLKRNKRAHACAQGTFSYTYAMFEKGPFSANIYVPYIFFVRPLLVYRTHSPVRECPKFQNHPLPICRTSFVDGPLNFYIISRLVKNIFTDGQARAG